MQIERMLKQKSSHANVVKFSKEREEEQLIASQLELGVHR